MSKRKGDPGYAAGWCIHFRDATRNATCESGVSYDTFKGSNPRQPWPCFLSVDGKPKPGSQSCEHLRCPTPEEIAAHKEWIESRMDRMRVVMIGIKPWRDQHKGKSAREVVTCPACQGRLHLAIAAYNGHVHARCETQGCVSWIE